MAQERNIQDFNLCDADIYSFYYWYDSIPYVDFVIRVNLSNWEYCLFNSFKN